MAAINTSAALEYATVILRHWERLDRGWKATVLGCLIIGVTVI